MLECRWILTRFDMKCLDRKVQSVQSPGRHRMEYSNVTEDHERDKHNQRREDHGNQSEQPNQEQTGSAS